MANLLFDKSGDHLLLTDQDTVYVCNLNVVRSRLASMELDW